MHPPLYEEWWQNDASDLTRGIHINHHNEEKGGKRGDAARRDEEKEHS